jgi:hypothetical protein
LTALASLSAETLPEGLSQPQEALWWLKKGGLKTGPEWQKAHELCQMQEGEPGHDLVHALVHWIEGDAFNAGYWYRRVGDHRAASIAAEWERIATLLTRS